MERPSPVDGSPRPRFPWVAVPLCAACLAAAAWCWMRYSYCWELGPEDVGRATWGKWSVRWPHWAYAEVAGKLADSEFTQRDSRGRYAVIVRNPRYAFMVVRARGSGSAPPPMTGELRLFRGRLSSLQYPLADNMDGAFFALDADAGRWTGASVAGLVVGAWGVFLLGWSTRIWLRRVREFDARRAAARGLGEGP